MLAGRSSTLVSPRHRLRSDSNSLAFQTCHLQVQEKLRQHQHTSQQKMGTQRLVDISCSFPRKEAPRISISVDNSIERRNSLSFRQIPITTTTPTSLSSSLVSPTVPWGKREAMEGVQWGKRTKGLKRLCDDNDEDYGDVYAVQSKRIKGCDGSSSNRLVGGGDDGIWFPHIIQYPLSTPAEAAAFGKEEVSDGSEKDTVGGASTSVGGQQRRTRSGSSSAPDDTPHCSSVRSPNEEEEEEEYSENETTAATRRETDEVSKTERQGLELMSLLMACLESVGSGNYVATNYFLARLGELASPEGTAIHRVVAYFTEALVLRVARLWPHAFCVVPPPKLVLLLLTAGGRVADDEGDDAMALRLLNHVSPIPRFLHFTLNEMLLKAFEGKDKVHIIDFDIKQGLQWPSLFQSLASRPNPPNHLRITGVGGSKRELQDTGVRLTGFAEALNLPFEFHAVVDRFEDVRFWMLHVKEGEYVAVNCVLQLHKALYDDTGGVLLDFLGLVRSTNPAIVLVAEQEAEHDDPRWEVRLASSLPYYSAIFDSVDASRLPADSPARTKIEEMFAREIRSIVACEGTERVDRHRAFSSWRTLMEDRAGFRCIGVGEREMLQSRMLLKMFCCEEEDGGGGGGFNLEMQGEDNAGGLTLKWQDQPLYTVSAWAPPADVAGSSPPSSSPSPSPSQIDS